MRLISESNSPLLLPVMRILSDLFREALSRKPPPAVSPEAPSQFLEAFNAKGLICKMEIAADSCYLKFEVHGKRKTASLHWKWLFLHHMCQNHTNMDDFVSLN